MKISETRDGTIIEVFVKPSSAKFKAAIEDDDFVVFCTEEPVTGKVNKELVKELSRLFHVRVEIVAGFASRQKRLLIAGAAKSDVERLLSVK